MENFNNDPKPGRLILPLVLIGMIATTYTFIQRVAENNDLEIISNEVVEEEDIVEDEIVEETTSTTSTTLPVEYVSYLEEINGERLIAISLGEIVLEANQNWDDKTVTYQEAKEEFDSFIENWLSFVETVSLPGLSLIHI